MKGQIKDLTDVVPVHAPFTKPTVRQIHASASLGNGYRQMARWMPVKMARRNA